MMWVNECSCSSVRMNTAVWGFTSLVDRTLPHPTIQPTQLIATDLIQYTHHALVYQTKFYVQWQQSELTSCASIHQVLIHQLTSLNWLTYCCHPGWGHGLWHQPWSRSESVCFFISSPSSIQKIKKNDCCKTTLFPVNKKHLVNLIIYLHEV